MTKRLIQAILILTILTIPCLTVIAHQAPDTKALVDQWKSPEPTPEHVHSNGKEIISFIPFATCVDAGLENAKSTSKPLLVFIKKPDCPHCLAFESGILRQPKLKEYIESHFVCARVLAGSTDDQVFKRDFGCNAYPHFVVFSVSGKLLGKWFGLPKSAKDFNDQAAAILLTAK